MAMTIDERGADGLRMSRPVQLHWSSIFAGAVTALGLWVLLYALGLALGLSSINPQDAESAKSSGIFTGIWSLVSPLVALFVGGIVAGRGSEARSRSHGGTHGLVMWGVTTLVGLWLVGSVLSSLAGGLVAVGKTAVQATGATLAAGASQAGNVGKVARSFGLDANDALKPINERLAKEGKPAVTAAQLETATQDVVQAGVQQGRIDRETLVKSIAQNTALSKADTEQLANEIQAQYDRFQGQVSQAAQQVQTGALKAADATGKAFWGVFGALFFGLISAVLGGSLGVNRYQLSERVTEVTRTPLVPPQREVFP